MDRISNCLIAGALVGATAITGAAADSIKGETPVASSQSHVSCTGAPNEVRLHVRDVKGATGLITVDLYANNADGFLKKAGRVAQTRVAARSPETFLCIHAPSAGGYAIALYHDKNANKTFDKGAFGIPVEPFGISNNPKLRFSAPPIEDALFEVADTGAIVEITLKN